MKSHYNTYGKRRNNREQRRLPRRRAGGEAAGLLRQLATTARAAAGPQARLHRLRPPALPARTGAGADAAAGAGEGEMNAALEEARQLHDAGYCVVPVKLDGTKAPDLTAWKQYKEVRAGLGEVEAWFGRKPAPGLGIIGGHP